MVDSSGEFDRAKTSVQRKRLVVLIFLIGLCLPTNFCVSAWLWKSVNSEIGWLAFHGFLISQITTLGIWGAMRNSPMGDRLISATIIAIGVILSYSMAVVFSLGRTLPIEVITLILFFWIMSYFPIVCINAFYRWLTGNVVIDYAKSESFQSGRGQLNIRFFLGLMLIIAVAIAFGKVILHPNSGYSANQFFLDARQELRTGFVQALAIWANSLSCLHLILQKHTGWKPIAAFVMTLGIGFGAEVLPLVQLGYLDFWSLGPTVAFVVCFCGTNVLFLIIGRTLGFRLERTTVVAKQSIGAITELPERD